MARCLVVLAVVFSLREPVEAGEIRLVDGPNSYSGRLEVFLNGVWGTVCDDRWDLTDANVACRQLGFFAAESAESSVSYGTGQDPVQMDDVACTGTEDRLLDCAYLGSDQENCAHSEDVSLVCTQHGVRLVDGPSINSGRVEVFMNGGLGSVCDDNWDINDATVACRHAGFPGAVSAQSGAFYGSGPDPILMGAVECTGTEVSLMDCGYADASSLSCGHPQDVGVVCSENIRLVDGPNSYSGRLEVFLNGEWGTVCDDLWDINDAIVACRQLGFSGADSAKSIESYGSGIGSPTQMDDVACTGAEDSLMECRYLDSSKENCGHTEDISLVCIQGGPSSFKYQRLANGCLDGFVLSVHTDVRSRMVCAVECSATTQCKSFNYVDESATCQLNSEVISNLDLAVNPLTGTCDYYEKLV